MTRIYYTYIFYIQIHISIFLLILSSYSQCLLCTNRIWLSENYLRHLQSLLSVAPTFSNNLSTLFIILLDSVWKKYTQIFRLEMSDTKWRSTQSCVEQHTRMGKNDSRIYLHGNAVHVCMCILPICTYISIHAARQSLWRFSHIRISDDIVVFWTLTAPHIDALLMYDFEYISKYLLFGVPETHLNYEKTRNGIRFYWNLFVISNRFFLYSSFLTGTPYRKMKYWIEEAILFYLE